jgi:hypothetical protein
LLSGDRNVYGEENLNINYPNGASVGWVGASSLRYGTVTVNSGEHFADTSKPVQHIILHTADNLYHNLYPRALDKIYLS